MKINVNDERILGELENNSVRVEKNSRKTKVIKKMRKPSKDKRK